MINNIGYLRRLQGRLDEAEALHLESARIREEIGDPVGVGRVHNLLAVVYNERGKFTEAISSGTIALHSAEQAADTLYIATAHAQLGDASFGLGRFDVARDHYREAEQLFTGLGDRQRRLETQLKLAEVDVAQGRSEQAQQSITQVLEQAREQQFGPLEIQALLQGAEIALEAAQGIALLDTALERARALGQSGDLIRVSIALAGRYLDAGDRAGAAPLLEYLEAQPESGALLKLRARQAWAEGNAEQAQLAMSRARELSGARWTEADERTLLGYQQ